MLRLLSKIQIPICFVTALFTNSGKPKKAPDISSGDAEKPELSYPPRGKGSHSLDQRSISAKLARFAQVPMSAISELEPNWGDRGLSEEVASVALKKYGANIPAAERRLAAFTMFWIAIANPFNILLTLLAIVSVATKQISTFGVMMAMVFASTGLRYWQEMKSMVQATRLIKSVSSRVRVIRSRGSLSSEMEIDQRQIVPGDILVIASGDVFPGDCVLISSEALSITQASLTGELMPVEKTVRLVAAPPEETFDILSNINICLAGTSVATGSGRALVISTGGDTYMASIAKELANRRPENATQMGIRRVSYVLLCFMLVMAPIVFVIQGAVSRNWKSAATFAIAVAVGLTPEMLPTIVTSNLALSAVRVARKKTIVKRLDAIQNLGAVKILCSDKTGTLTADIVRVSTSTTSTGDPSSLPIKLAYINALSQTGTRSPIDRAIVDHVQRDEKGSFTDVLADQWIKHGEIPFESSRRLLSILVSRHDVEVGEGLLITKGAVEEVLDHCVALCRHDLHNQTFPHFPPLPQDFLTPSTSSPLTNDTRRGILEVAQRQNEDGFRLVAVACRRVMIKPFMRISTSDEEDLVFVGFLGFLDPVKPDARKAIEDLGKLNVQVRILTGDVPAVAGKVARDLGLLPPRKLPPIISASHSSHIDIEASTSTAHLAHEADLIITGSQLEALSEDKGAYLAAIERCIIFAKLSPYQKLDVVKALRAGGGGRAVAFLGDGVNDALAIRGADVGISVDSGTEIAKEAADVILLEKSLGVVADGVLQGRMTLINTIKYIKMATSSNFGNVFSVLIASAWLPYQPMLPLQILVQNLLYDFSQASIPWDNVDPECLEQPKEWDAKSIIRFMICLGPFSSPFDIITFSINWFKYGIRTLNSPLVSRAQTNWFLEGSLTQLFIIQFLRTGKVPFIQSRASTPVVIVTFGVACIAMAVPYVPKLNASLQMKPPLPEFYAYLAAMIVGYSAVVHIVKILYQAAFKEWL